MEGERALIRLSLHVEQPIELSDFLGAFTALAAEYDRFVRAEHPGDNPEATLFVKDVRHGSIHADLIPWLVGAGGVFTALSKANTLAEFVERYGKALGRYLKPGGRAPEATKSQLSDFAEQVAAIANNPNSSIEIAAVEIENGTDRVKAAFQFNTSQARDIQQRVEEHKRDLDHTSHSDYQRMLMVFTRSDVRTTPLGKRSGEQVKVERISPNPRPLIYASELAEQHIKHEIADSADNVFKKGFIVDLNVETQGGKPVAYSVTALHSIIDLDDTD